MLNGTKKQSTTGKTKPVQNSGTVGERKTKYALKQTYCRILMEHGELRRSNTSSGGGGGGGVAERYITLSELLANL